MKSTLAAFRSLAMARDKIRRLKGSGNQWPFTVDLLPDTYPIEESLVLGPEDAGREGSAVLYRAAEPETVFLFWTRAMKLSDFSKVSELEELERFDLVARDQVVHLPIAGSGRLPLSRWPNQGMTAMAEIIKVGEKDNLTVNEDPSFANPAESDVASAIRAADNSLISLGWLEGEPTLEPSDPPAWQPISPKAAQP
jgi:hypothetical protein